jgi:acyl-CoA synthetase (AMP-forming)/AMP-acid ligase II
MVYLTLANLLWDPTSNAPAIIAAGGGFEMSYRQLADEVERLAEDLCSTNLRPDDSVALVLPNGPEILTLILAIARARLIAAPVNPAFKSEELGNLLKELHPTAIITDAGNRAAAEVAADLGIPAWQVALTERGTVSLQGLPLKSRVSIDAPTEDDVALFLHTSGTEGRPKIVPLSHANVFHSACKIATHYGLSPNDRTLVVTPLFHGHGLIGAALSTLASGGAVIVPPRFSASHFWGAFLAHGATWYTAVPTIHEILLQRADTDDAPHSSPRFIRSCSAALAPAVRIGLERRFGAPVIEAYGITEATHQVASNPLPPSERKPGSVGVGVGTEIEILDGLGQPLPAGRVGEVVIRGPGVMSGYYNNPQATAAAFINGWLRTGDLGALSEGGFLTLTGRIKEMINRGGEKISPTEIDAVLMAHPAVAQAASFGVPDAKYGEEVEAAVVIKSGVTAGELQDFARQRLADFKIPKVIHFVSNIPSNALGKLERRALSNSYGHASSAVLT